MSHLAIFHGSSKVLVRLFAFNLFFTNIRRINCTTAQKIKFSIKDVSVIVTKSAVS